MRITYPTFGVLFLAVMGSAGCAAAQALHTESSTAAIRSAEELGASDVPQASLYLQLAKEELLAANDLNTRKKPEEAASLLLCAEADAELAIALSQADAEKEAAKTAYERVRTLQTENPYAPGAVE